MAHLKKVILDTQAKPQKDSLTTCRLKVEITLDVDRITEEGKYSVESIYDMITEIFAIANMKEICSEHSNLVFISKERDWESIPKLRESLFLCMTDQKITKYFSRFLMYSPCKN